MPDFDEKNRLGGLYPTSYCGPREIMMAPNEDGKSLKPEPILMTTLDKKTSLDKKSLNQSNLLSSVFAPSDSLKSHEL